MKLSTSWCVVVTAVVLAPGCDKVFGLSRPEVPPDASLGRDVPHVPSALEYLGGVDLVLEDVTIDTTLEAFDPPLDVQGIRSRQEFDDGPDLWVIHARDVAIRGRVRVIGKRALVIIANGITVAGVLDVSAAGDVHGAGGPREDPVRGRGDDGFVGSMESDSGGGGGAHSGRGGAGGNVSSGFGLCAVGGEGGMIYGTIAVGILEGGGSGGNGAGELPCPPARGGGGGGAVQLSALDRITIVGTIDAGGAGGAGGSELGCGINPGAGGGGGAGGAIYVDAPTIQFAGTVAANGGGGGAGGCYDTMGSRGFPGFAGDNATVSMLPASGGAPPDCGAATGTSGGNGAAGVSPPAPGSPAGSACGINTGGGGGAAGRIVFRGEVVGTGTVATPTPTIIPM